MGDSQADKGGWERTAKDLFAGAAGGIAQVLLGPFGPTSRCMMTIYHCPGLGELSLAFAIFLANFCVSIDYGELQELR